ncbi:DNA gyrase inhibitor YacG [Caldichromatium japonicum]|nr:DNA gyrase inhibitor YacG [Caldichromatium japonicum]
MVKTVACPTCGKPVPWMPESRWRPFCSEHCRLIDLGDWLAEHHRISGPEDEGAGSQSEGDGEQQPPH